MRRLLIIPLLILALAGGCSEKTPPTEGYAPAPIANDSSVAY